MREPIPTFQTRLLRRIRHLAGLVWEIASLPLALFRVGGGVHSGVHQIPPAPARSATDGADNPPPPSHDPVREARRNRKRERARALFAKANWDDDSESSDHLALG